MSKSKTLTELRDLTHPKTTIGDAIAWEKRRMSKHTRAAMEAARELFPTAAERSDLFETQTDGYAYCSLQQVAEAIDRHFAALVDSAKFAVQAEEHRARTQKSALAPWAQNLRAVLRAVKGD